MPNSSELSKTLVGAAFVVGFFVVLLILIIGRYPLAAAIIAAIITRLMYSSYMERRRKDEYRSLLVSFAHELEENFHRCILYHTQRQEGTVSFSAIYDFNDTSTLSKLASVTDNPKIVDAIMFLKKQYYQVGRHVENTSWSATEYDKQMMEIKRRLSPEKIELFDLDIPGTWRYLGLGGDDLVREAKKFKDEAHRAQGIALAFFGIVDNDDITYPKIVNYTLMLIEELKEKWSSDVTEEIEKRFLDDRDKLRELENEKRQQQNVDQNVDQTKKEASQNRLTP
jgi:Tfp pilus assembly protein PilE